MALKILDIARIHCNCVEARGYFLGEGEYVPKLLMEAAPTGHDRMALRAENAGRHLQAKELKEPAMRLGIARAPIRLRDVLYKDRMGFMGAVRSLWSHARPARRSLACLSLFRRLIGGDRNPLGARRNGPC
jgi:hypothetical protein